MKIRKISPTIVLLMTTLVIIGVAIVVTANPPGPRVESTHMAVTPPAGTATSQATANPTQETPPPASPVVSPTVPVPDETPPPTHPLVATILPNVIAEETFVPLGPTPDATEQARSSLSRYLINKLYYEPATLVAHGINTTPIPSEFYVDLSLLTYEVSEVNLPQEATWDAWVPSDQGGFELRAVTFDQAWRVTVKGEGFFVGNSIWLMFADSRLLGRCVFANGGLTSIVYDRDLLTNGARLGVSFGGSSVTYLPEALDLPPVP